MEWLLESGEMDVNAQDMMGCTPLRRAASVAEHEHCRLLFEHGTNSDHWGRLPMQILRRGEAVRDRPLFRRWDPAEHLSDERDRAAYLAAALETGDPRLVAAVKGDIARSRGASAQGIPEALTTPHRGAQRV